MSNTFAIENGGILLAGMRKFDDDRDKPDENLSLRDCLRSGNDKEGRRRMEHIWGAAEKLDFDVEVEVLVHWKTSEQRAASRRCFGSELGGSS